MERADSTMTLVGHGESMCLRPDGDWLPTLHDALAVFQQVRAKASSENDRLAHRHGIASVDAPIVGLNIIHQQATLAAELLSYYIGWSLAPANVPTDLERRHIENNQRFITAGKSALILSLSAVESSAKCAVAERPGLVPMNGGRVYLRRIIRRSADAGMLSPEMEMGWEAVIELRNTLVHSNAVPERTLEVHLPGGPRIAMSSGQMLLGSRRLLPEVLLWTTGAFAEWADAFLQRTRAS